MIDATGNWWGTTDIATIGDNVYDNNDGNSYAPVVNFLPMLDSAGGSLTTGTALVGPIDIDQTLIAGASYDVLSDIVVEAGATLTIPEGTILKFHGATAALTVDGALTIAGTVANPVIFTSGKATPARGNWQGLVFGPTSTGSVIDHADIQWAQIGVDVSGASVTIQNSQISNFQSAGIKMFDGAGGLIADNAITGSGNGYGIHMMDAAVDVAGYELTISGNTISNLNYGIWVEKHSTPVINGGNEITGNVYGIRMQGNRSAVDMPMAVINGNSLHSNNNYDVYASNYSNAGASVVIDATGNWWGTTDIATIGDNVYDNNDGNSYAPVVNFQAILETAL